jgi:hypothetical protein
MTPLLDRVFQFLVLVIAIGLTLYWDLTPQVQKLFFQHHEYFDPKYVIPIVSGFIYLVLLVILAAGYNIPFVRSRIDKKYGYWERYLSLPYDHPDELNIFEIKPDFLSTKYRLKGHRYLLSTERAAGKWSSESLDMPPKGDAGYGNLRYVYWGHKEELETAFGRQPRGDGYANILLLGENLENGTGYWIDDVGKTLERHHSRYYKLTSHFRRRTLNMNLASRLRWSEISIVKAFAELPDAEQTRLRRPPVA